MNKSCPSSPTASSVAARNRMVANSGRNSKPEIELRSALHRLGLRFRIDRRPLLQQKRRADIVFGPAKVAVYVDGCFWHGCPVHGTWPKANADFWRDKIETNRRRDQDTNERLIKAGWVPIRVWEHEPVPDATARIASIVRSRSESK